MNVRENLDEISRIARVASQGGIDTLWIVDFPATRLAPAVASVIAHENEDMHLGIGLVSPFLHRPVQIIRFIKSLVDQFGDRFDLLLGPGDIIQLMKVGVKVDMSTLLEKMMKAIKAIREGLRDLEIGSRVLLGAQGFGLVKLSSTTDGVLLNYSDPAMIEWVAKQIGETSEDFQIGVFPPTFLSDEKDCDGNRSFRTSAAVVALGLNRTAAREFGLDASIGLARRIARVKGRIDAEVLEILGKDTIKRFGLCGSVDDVRGYVERVANLGVGQIVFGPPLGTDSLQVELLVEGLRQIS
ncbi:MAG: LLM class flavin-dependent oxidoreductase [Candidatus Thorarchaeota archaeon]